MEENDFIKIRRKEQAELFNKLVQLNVNEHTETKNDLTYLSWAWAWQEFKKVCPDAYYEIVQFTSEDGVFRCYQYDEKLGYMVFTRITAQGITHEMWLPVMDGANKAVKSVPYKYKIKKYEWDNEKRKNVWKGEYEDKSVEAATMFDINKTIMRCLTKNIAMFGLGLYIYAGEDLPIEIADPCTEEQIKQMRELKVNETNVCRRFKVDTLEELSYKNAEFIINTKKKDNESAGVK